VVAEPVSGGDDRSDGGGVGVGPSTSEEDDVLVRVLPGSYWKLIARRAGRQVGPPARD
jgi:hypothetical protein